MEDEASLRKWLKETDLNQYLKDKEVQAILTSLKERIATIKESNVTSSPRTSSAQVSSGSQAHVMNEQDLDLSKCARIKMVVVGDGAVGKTSLLIAYATDKFPTEYVPTVFENYSTQIPRDDGSILLHLWDTAGQEDYDRLRPLSYPGADIVLLCFSTVNRASATAIKEKWWPEVRHYVPNVPFLLVGTKVDCRESKQVDPNLGRYDPVTADQGRAIADEIKAVMYLEVSAKTRAGLVPLFQEAINVVLAARGDPTAKAKAGLNRIPKKEKTKCSLV